MNKNEIKGILEKHKAFLIGKGGERADLSEADLSKADLRGANLIGADLIGANLRGANLSKADLSEANLSKADLSKADLSKADLSKADLSEANLRGAYLSKAYLIGANLIGANLSEAYLIGAYLIGANLIGANLSEADVDISQIPQIKILPEGDIIGWKTLKEGRLAKLQIPATAKRVNSTGRKCRCEYVDVLEIHDSKGNAVSVGLSNWNRLIYAVGERVSPDKFCDDFRIECSHGIHFFITREEAVKY